MTSLCPSRSVLLVISVLILGIPSLAGAANHKVDLCHVDSEGAIVLLNVSERAVPKHLNNHGDFLPLAFYSDGDGDGFGDSAAMVTACTAPDGFVDNGNDCDDTDPDVNPGADEACNGVDDNCSTEVDEGGVCTLSSCPCLTPGSFFEQLVAGEVTLEPRGNGFCYHSVSTSLVFLEPYAVAVGGEAYGTGMGGWACESSAGLSGDVGFLIGLPEEDARACADLVRDALVASGVDPVNDCDPW